MNINIKVNKLTRTATPEQNKIGVDGENLQGNIIFYFEDEFVDGEARLEYETSDGKAYIPLTKVDKTYVSSIKNVITKEWRVNMQLVITEAENEEGIPLFKSDEFAVYVTGSINAVDEAPEGYDLWIDIANAKIIEIDRKISETNQAILNAERLDLNISKEKDGAIIAITKQDGSTESKKIYDGNSGITVFDIVNGKLIATSESFNNLTRYGIEENHLYLNIN